MIKIPTIKPAKMTSRLNPRTAPPSTANTATNAMCSPFRVMRVRTRPIDRPRHSSFSDSAHACAASWRVEASAGRWILMNVRPNKRRKDSRKYQTRLGTVPQTKFFQTVEFKGQSLAVSQMNSGCTVTVSRGFIIQRLMLHQVGTVTCSSNSAICVSTLTRSAPWKTPSGITR